MTRCPYCKSIYRPHSPGCPADRDAMLALLLPVIRERVGAVSPTDIAYFRATLGLPALPYDTLQTQADTAQRQARTRENA